VRIFHVCMAVFLAVDGVVVVVQYLPRTWVADPQTI
jgi:hypothetical protein